MTRLLALVDAAFVRLAADAITCKPADPGLGLGGAVFLGTRLPAARDDFLLVTAVTTDSLHLVARSTRAKVAQLITVVLATVSLTQACLVTDGSECCIVRARSGTLDSKGCPMRRAADD